MDTMEEGPNGALYRLDPDFSLHKLDEKIIVSNGPCWSPDGATFYFADTWTGDIWAYDYDQSTGAASNRRTFVSVDRSRGGAADGSTVDAEGCLWNALVYDGRLVRYDPNGRIDRVIDMPVKKITSVMFGGPNLDILFITSMARPPLPRFPGDGRLRGSLFAIMISVSGDYRNRASVRNGSLDRPRPRSANSTLRAVRRCRDLPGDPSG